MTIWIFCPVYQDVPSFLILRDNIRRELAGSSFGDHRFVVLDDTAGADPSMTELAHVDDVVIISPPFPLGHQRGLVFAVRTILDGLPDDDIVVTMDSDGEDRPEDVPKLLAPLISGEVPDDGLVLAQRTRRRESIRFRLFYRLFRICFRLLTGTVISSGNFAAYRVQWARRRLTHPHFDLAYSSTLVTISKSVTLVPCPRGSRYQGRSRMNSSSLMMHGLRMLMPFMDRIAMRSLVLFVSTFAVSVTGALVVLAVRLVTDLAIPGWTTYSLMSLTVLSIVALGNFVVLFAVFSQSQGLSLSDLESPRS